MAAVAKKPGQDQKLYNYAWTGKDKAGKVVKGEVRAGGEAIVAANLRRQGIQVSSIKKRILRVDSAVWSSRVDLVVQAEDPYSVCARLHTAVSSFEAN